MDKTVSFCVMRGGASILALNSTDNRLIAAGQQSKNEGKQYTILVFLETDFQLFSVEPIDRTEQFIEIHDFRNTPLPSTVSRWCALQPKDVAWSWKDGYFSRISSVRRTNIDFLSSKLLCDSQWDEWICVYLGYHSIDYC